MNVSHGPVRPQLLGLHPRQRPSRHALCRGDQRHLRRVHEHREGLTPGFTSRWGVTRLVYFETFGDIEEAIAREKALKRWRRDWKVNLIEKSNPDWVDLYDGIAQNWRL